MGNSYILKAAVKIRFAQAKMNSPRFLKNNRFFCQVHFLFNRTPS
jgi:hypothetical protein